MLDAQLSAAWDEWLSTEGMPRFARWLLDKVSPPAAQGETHDVDARGADAALAHVPAADRREVDPDPAGADREPVVEDPGRLGGAPAPSGCGDVAGGAVGVAAPVSKPAPASILAALQPATAKPAAPARTPVEMPYVVVRVFCRDHRESRRTLGPDDAQAIQRDPKCPICRKTSTFMVLGRATRIAHDGWTDREGKPLDAPAPTAAPKKPEPTPRAIHPRDTSYPAITVNGELLAPRRYAYGTAPETCTVKDCKDPHHAIGLCAKHRARYQHATAKAAKAS